MSDQFPETYPTEPVRESHPWRNALATLLLVVAVVTSPVAVVSGWAKARMVPTDTFVSTFAPLSDQPALQQTVSTKLVTAIEQQTTDSGVPQAISKAIGSALEAPVERFVRSDAFETLWADALRSVHARIAGEAAPSGSTVGVSDSGQVALQLGPITQIIKQDLVDHGFELAARIPESDKSVAIATLPHLPDAERAYDAVDRYGTWVPPLTIGCLVLGLIVASRRRMALSLTGIGVALAMGATWLSLDLGRQVATSQLSGDVSAATVHEVWDQAVETLRRLVLWVGGGALVLAFLSGLAALVRRR